MEGGVLVKVPGSVLKFIQRIRFKSNMTLWIKAIETSVLVESTLSQKNNNKKISYVLLL